MKKKKIIVFSLILILIFGIFFRFSNNAMAIEDDILDDIYEKGQLRCPLDYSNCQEETDAEGKVNSVTVTYTEKFDDGAEVIIDKIVRKTETLGTYSVQFRVRGNGNFERVSLGRVNVVVIFDKSKTMSSSGKKKAIQAIKDFSTNLTTGNDNFYIALVQFAKSATKLKNVKFQNTPINSIKGDFGISSHLEKALSRAYSALSTVEGGKYIVVFGDGRYYLDYPNESVCKGEGNGGSSNNCTTRWRQSVHGTSSVEYYLNMLDSIGTIRYGVYYKSANNSNYTGKVTKKNSYVTDCDGLDYLACDEVYMRKVARDTMIPAANADAYADSFAKILATIKQSAERTSSKIEGELSDLIGSDFYMSDESSDTSKTQNFYIEEINSTGYTTPSFNVEIDPTTSTGWHKVNDYYTLKVKTGTGEKTITVTENPEVYWKGESLNINSCSGEATHDTEEIARKEDYKYYSKVCSEGYLNGKKYVEGYKVRINVDNATDGQKSFALENGRGFPTTVKLSTNIKCTYAFKVDDYNKDYTAIENSIKSYNSSLSSSTLPENQTALDDLIEANKDNPDFVAPSITKDDIRKEIAGLESSLSSLQQVLETYKSLANTDDIKDYKERFEEQPAVVRVTYEDGSYDSLDLVNLNVADEDIKVSSKKAVKVNGSSERISPETTATLHLEKEMGLIETCLNMSDSEQVDCELDSNQISGGNMFYVDLAEPQGSVSVFVTGAGYHNGYDFKLDTDEIGNPVCEFTNSVDRLDFRQIELDDPFIKEIDSKRGVGKNYLNNTFDFEKIIHGDTWNSKYEPEYYYIMSKTNVANIKRDSAEDSMNSYLGRSCYFTNNNKWYCHFARNEDDDGTDNGTSWFTDFKADDGIN